MQDARRIKGLKTDRVGTTIDRGVDVIYTKSINDWLFPCGG